MTDSPSASLLITPDLRRRLQQRYAEAQRLAASPKPDYRKIHDLLAECLRADPGSVLYLDALIANLRRRDSAAIRSWLPNWFQSHHLAESDVRSSAVNDSSSNLSAEYSVLSTQYAWLRNAPDLLWKSTNDSRLLRQLATAASTFDLDQVELRYLQLALELAPQDADNLRHIARACTRQGRFGDAIEFWKCLVQSLPDDGEVLQALSDLTDQSTQFDETERTLVESQAAGAPLLESLQQREQLQLARSEHRLAIARRRTASDPYPKSLSLVNQLEAEHARLEIEIFHLRCERHPRDWRLRLDLARRLKLARNFSGAIQRLEEADELRPGEPEVLIELGECWQHLRQFATSAEYYDRAIAAAVSANANGTQNLEALKLARYRAAVLAAAQGNNGAARSNLAALLAIDPAFKDAQQRLDNLGPN